MASHCSASRKELPPNIINRQYLRQYLDLHQRIGWDGRSPWNASGELSSAVRFWTLCEGHVDNRDAPGAASSNPSRDVGVARVRHLTVDAAQRLINACNPDFHPRVRAALETGCRYSELTRLEVALWCQDDVAWFAALRFPDRDGASIGVEVLHHPGRRFV